MKKPEWMTSGIVPDELRFAITRKCPGNCRHCYNQSGRDIDRLSAEDFKGIIRELHLMNPRFDRITITGGEPMTEPEKVLSIARFSHSLGIRIRLVTRGWELTPEICNELRTSGITRVQIGLDSSGKIAFEESSGMQWDTCHSWLRGDREGYHKTLESIKIAIASGLEVSVRHSLCHSNSDDVVNTFELVSDLGVRKFKFRILFPDGRAKKSLIGELITGREMAVAQYELIQASRFHSAVVEITQPCFFPIPSRIRLEGNEFPFHSYKEPCPCGTTAAYIDSNGDVKYCLFDEKVLGNVLSEPFTRIWNSELMAIERKARCPVDCSGTGCSSFKILYSQFKDYSVFMQEYSQEVKKRPLLAVS